MTKTIVLATSNPGKIRELSQLLSLPGMALKPQSDFQIDAPAETAHSFVENALIKARHAATHAGIPAIADDSGLVVPYLKGEPGVYSARYAGSASSDQENNKKLIAKLRELEAMSVSRAAFFKSVLVYLEHPRDPSPVICHGTWHGHIVDLPLGTNGFGYDPHFLVDSEQCTAAQLDTVSKNRLSHRGQAASQLRRHLLSV